VAPDCQAEIACQLRFSPPRLRRGGARRGLRLARFRAQLAFLIVPLLGLPLGAAIERGRVQAEPVSIAASTKVGPTARGGRLGASLLHTRSPISIAARPDGAPFFPGPARLWERPS
jgi:hypothetical protein